MSIDTQRILSRQEVEAQRIEDYTYPRQRPEVLNFVDSFSQ